MAASAVAFFSPPKFELDHSTHPFQRDSSHRNSKVQWVQVLRFKEVKNSFFELTIPAPPVVPPQVRYDWTRRFGTRAPSPEGTTFWPNGYLKWPRLVFFLPLGTCFVFSRPVESGFRGEGHSGIMS